MKHRAAIPVKSSRGFTMAGLMVAMVIGMFVSLAAIAAFSAHSRTVFNQMTYIQSAEDVSEAFALLSRLIQQAERSNIVISGVTTVGGCTSNITVDLAIPEGFPVWPNLSAPYDKNRVRIVLSDTGANAHGITIANAAPGGLGAATAMPFAGSNTGNNTKITCMSLVRQLDETYAFSIAGYARNYTSGDTAYEGVIYPRN